MKKTCDVCGARMLTFENPDRLMCPRANKHYLYVNTGTIQKRELRKKA